MAKQINQKIPSKTWLKKMRKQQQNRKHEQ